MHPDGVIVIAAREDKRNAAWGEHICDRKYLFISKIYVQHRGIDHVHV